MGLIATLKPATSTWNDGSDATYSSATIFIDSPPPELGTCDPGDTGALDDGPGAGAIVHLVFRARVKALNPSGSGEAAGQSSPRIYYAADHPSAGEAEKACGAAPENAGFGWVETSPVTLAPDGQPWDWARIASIRAVRMRTDWYQDLDPASGNHELQMSEVEVLVYGPDPVVVTPAPGALAVTGHAPTVGVSGGLEVVPQEPLGEFFKHEIFWRTGRRL